MTDQERTAISLAESIESLFEEQRATQSERYSALQIVAALQPLITKADSESLPFPSDSA